MHVPAFLPRILFPLGLVCTLAGAFDPLEGSVVILVGVGLLALSTWLSRSRHRRLFWISFALVFAGVAALFVLSALGGVGGHGGVPVGWAAFIIPYPVGWIATLVGIVLVWRESRHNVLARRIL